MWVLWIYGIAAVISVIIIVSLIFKRIKDRDKEDFEKRKY